MVTRILVQILYCGADNVIILQGPQWAIASPEVRQVHIQVTRHSSTATSTVRQKACYCMLQAVLSEANFSLLHRERRRRSTKWSAGGTCRRSRQT